MITPERNAPAVDLREEFSVEIQRGMIDARAFYASGRRTLVSSIPLDDFADWDGSDERALVSDPDGIDLLDEEELVKAA